MTDVGAIFRGAGPRQRGRGGFLLLETFIALTILVALAVTLAIAVGQHKRGTLFLAQMRTATRVAEQTLLALQTNTARPVIPADTTVGLRRLTESAPVAGYVWVEVTATNQGRRAVLVGLMPAAAGGVP